MASRSGLPNDCVNERWSSSHPCFSTAALISSAAAFHASTWSWAPSRSASVMARSSATQHITFEWTKCRGSPRTSQMPLSG